MIGRAYVEQKNKIPEEELRFAQSPDSNVTAIFLTCCRRYSHLYDSVASFIKLNKYPIKDIYILQDGGLEDYLPPILDRFPQVRLLTTGGHVGQLYALDILLGHFVSTAYYFYTEDDWLMIRGEVLEENIKRLEQNPKVLQVWNRNHGVETIVDPVTRIVDDSWQWAGFSFNPSVNRMADYRLIEGGFSGISQNMSFGLGAGYSEQIISKFFKKKGYRVMQYEYECFNHLGDQDGSTKEEVAEVIQDKHKNDEN
jgi:hypothetical protein